jgi:hypothetical protein
LPIAAVFHEVASYVTTMQNFGGAISNVHLLCRALATRRDKVLVT